MCERVDDCMKGSPRLDKKRAENFLSMEVNFRLGREENRMSFGKSLTLQSEKETNGTQMKK